jgi:hypothetical protein
MRKLARSIGVVAALSALWLVGCGGSGMGKGVRQDIMNTMDGGRTSFAECYGEALKRNRETAGTVVLRFKVAANSGQFTNAEVIRSNTRDAELEQCVLTKVSALKLSKPQKTVLGVERYPLEFTPSN